MKTRINLLRQPIWKVFSAISIISILAAFIVVLPTYAAGNSSSAPTPTPTLQGDLNVDGRIDCLDLILLQMSLNGVKSPNPLHDIDDNGNFIKENYIEGNSNNLYKQYTDINIDLDFNNKSIIYLFHDGAKKNEIEIPYVLDADFPNLVALKEKVNLFITYS